MRGLASRSRAHRGWELCSCLCLLVGAACSDSQAVPLPEIEWEGEHLRAGGDLDDACEGNLPYMDAMVGELQQRLETPGEGLVDFYYFATGELPLSGHCGTNDAPVACTNEYQEIFSRWIPEEHELVHAVHAEVGFSNPFLEEGLAEFLGDDGLGPGRGEPQGTPSEAISAVHDQDLPFGYYAVAGHFVSFLDGEFGTSGMMERIDDLDFDSTAPEVEAALGAGVDGGFAALEDEYQAVPKCAQAAYRDAGPMCNVVAPLFDHCSPDEDTVVEVDVDCGGDDVLGPRKDEIWTYRRLDIVNSGSYTITAQGGADYLTDGITLKRCEGGCEAPPTAVQVFDEDDIFAGPVSIELESGRYLVRVTRPVDDPATIRIRFGGDECE